jgi:hypothetical protein
MKKREKNPTRPFPCPHLSLFLFLGLDPDWLVCSDSAEERTNGMDGQVVEMTQKEDTCDVRYKRTPKIVHTHLFLPWLVPNATDTMDRSV